MKFLDSIFGKKEEKCAGCTAALARIEIFERTIRALSDYVETLGFLLTNVLLEKPPAELEKNSQILQETQREKLN